jgi:hypothetical protein
MSDSTILHERARRVEEAFHLLQGNKDNLGNIPGILRQLISLRVWEGYDWRGKTVSFGTFREFVEAPPPEGLGTTIDELVRFCRKYPEIADQIDQTVQEQVPDYRPPKREHNAPPYKKARGNSYQRSLRRLRNLAVDDKKAADLRKQVMRGEISPNHALMELGKLNARYGVEATPESVVAFINKHLKKGDIRKVVDALKNP